jgi:hypothetical protein
MQPSLSLLQPLTYALCSRQVKISSPDAVGQLKDVRGRIGERDAIAISESETFTLVYSVLRNFGDFTSEAQQCTCDVILDAVNGVRGGCKRALHTSASDDALATMRSTLQMAVFLLGWLVHEAEKLQAKAVQMPAARTKRGAKAPQGGKGWQWEDFRETAAHRLQEVAWGLPIVVARLANALSPPPFLYDLAAGLST